MTKKLRYTKPFRFYFKDDRIELRLVLTNMHAYEYSRACLHTERVVELYVDHANVPDFESNENHVQQSSDIDDKVQEEVADKVQDEMKDDENVNYEFVDDDDLNDEVKDRGVDDETKDYGNFIDKDYVVRYYDDLFEVIVENGIPANLDTSANREDNTKNYVVKETQVHIGDKDQYLIQRNEANIMGVEKKDVVYGGEENLYEDGSSSDELEVKKKNT